MTEAPYVQWVVYKFKYKLKLRGSKYVFRNVRAAFVEYHSIFFVIWWNFDMPKKHINYTT